MKHTDIPLPYGVKNNSLVTIEEVESGLECNCNCPACGERLIARKGFQMVHHFAHQAKLDCQKGVEASLHRLCKEILAKEKHFTIPSLLFGIKEQYEVFPETEIPIDSVKLQYIADSMVPDIIIESKGQQLLVEITANNRVSEEKKQLLKKRNMAGIEIHIKELLKDLFEINDFRLSNRIFKKELISNTMHKYWLHSPLLVKIEAILKSKYAHQKKVGSFKTESGDYFYIESCPLEKRIWQGGFKKGKTYASREDCNECDFCIARQKNPEAIFCLGHLSINEFQQLLRTIR